MSRQSHAWSDPKQKPLILVVDDESKNLQVVGNLLRQKQWDISFAKSGRQALESVHEDPPDLILLDVMMPRMDGYEVCRRLKANKATAPIPVIFLTARSEKEDLVEGFNNGGVDFVTKPFQHEELLARVETHLELYRTRRELEVLNANQNRFFSIIAHDLRSPFSGLRLFTQTLERAGDSLTPDQIRELGRDLGHESERLAELLENLLKWAGSQMNRIEFAPIELSLHEAVISAFHLADSQARAKKITLVNDVPSDLVIQADTQMLNTILRNLLSNAIKFTPEGGRVTVKARALDDREGVRLEVSDTGVGIPPEVIGKLFQLGERVSSLGTREERGSGFGLILCEQFVRRHGGLIRAESKPDEGSTFIIELPSCQ